MRLQATVSACAAVLIVGAATTSAQTTATTDRPEVIVRLESDLGSAAFDFWTTRLNDYKNRIDRALTGDDLATLERLRVRWAILIDQALRSAIAVHDGDTTAVRFDMGEMNNAMEIASIYTSARELAGRYRPDLDRLSTDVLDDVTTFVGDMASRANQFIDANRSAFEADSGAAKIVSHRSDLIAAVEDLRSDKTRKGLESIYPLAIEPIIMLYDGTDLKALLEGAMPASAALPGMELPDMSALKQNAPNPASAATTIAYELDVPGTRVVIEVFGSDGAMVASYDQGAQSAGEHTTVIDVSSLASGSYVYRLAVETASGPRVCARVMRVVH